MLVRLLVNTQFILFVIHHTIKIKQRRCPCDEAFVLEDIMQNSLCHQKGGQVNAGFAIQYIANRNCTYV
jgi:hypothetical protein